MRTGLQRVLDDARLTEAPVPVALHRYAEGIIPVSREWPVDTARLMQQDPDARQRRQDQSERLDDFLRRAVDEDFLRSDAPLGWVRAVLDQLVASAAHQFPELAAPQAADIVVDTFLAGLART